MHVDIAGAQELGVLEVVELKVLEAVAHVLLARQERLAPQHLAIAQDAAGTFQVSRQCPKAQLRAEAAGAQLGMRQVQVVAPFHHMVGKLVAQGVAEAVWRAVGTDQVQPDQLRLFAGIFGKGRQRQVGAGAHDDAAVALVEPLRLRALLARWRPTAFQAPLEHAHAVSDGAFGLLLVHLVAGGGAAQVGQAGTGHQAVGRVLVVQRWQYAAFGQQGQVVMALAQPGGLHFAGQVTASGYGLQGQLTGAGGAQYFKGVLAFHHAHAARAGGGFELDQSHACARLSVAKVSGRLRPPAWKPGAGGAPGGCRPRP
ncbi:hypothetical protein D3C81_1114990 [compost metagenome]